MINSDEELQRSLRSGVRLRERSLVRFMLMDVLTTGDHARMFDPLMTNPDFARVLGILAVRILRIVSINPK